VFKLFKTMLTRCLDKPPE